MTMQKMMLPKGGWEAIQQAVAKVAAAKAAARPVKPGRVTLLSLARQAVAKGQLPPVLEFGSERNYSYNAHAKALRDLALAGDVAGLAGYPLKGSNTYARALKGYRDLLLDHAEKVSGEATLELQSNPTNAAKAAPPKSAATQKVTKAKANMPSAISKATKRKQSAAALAK